MSKPECGNCRTVRRTHAGVQEPNADRLGDLAVMNLTEMEAKVPNVLVRLSGRFS